MAGLFLSETLNRIMRMKRPRKWNKMNEVNIRNTRRPLSRKEDNCWGPKTRN